MLRRLRYLRRVPVAHCHEDMNPSDSRDDCEEGGSSEEVIKVIKVNTS